MNFQNIAPVERSNHYLDLAFRKAREKSGKKLTGEWLERVKKKEMIKLDVAKDQLVSRLDKIIKSFPSLDHLPKFYLELLKLTLDYKELKRALGGVNWVMGRIRFFHKNYVRKITKSKEVEKMRSLRGEFYGRVSSAVKQIDQQLFFLEQSRKTMKKYPDVKEMFTVVIFGFPNVGKTTLLNKLTGARGEVAQYAFTTTSINSGFMEIREENTKTRKNSKGIFCAPEIPKEFLKESEISCVPKTISVVPETLSPSISGFSEIQVLDVPGTLARVEKMNNIERIAYLAVKELACVVVYIFDLSGEGYSLEKQEKLLKGLKRNIGKEKKILIYLSKRDTINKKKVEKFSKKYNFFDLDELKEKIEKLI